MESIKDINLLQVLFFAYPTLILFLFIKIKEIRAHLILGIPIGIIVYESILLVFIQDVYIVFNHNRDRYVEAISISLFFGSIAGLFMYFKQVKCPTCCKRGYCNLLNSKTIDRYSSTKKVKDITRDKEGRITSTKEKIVPVTIDVVKNTYKCTNCEEVFSMNCEREK